MCFRKGGQLSRDTQFFYNGNMVEIVHTFTYLGVVFSTSGSFTEAQKTLSGQALKSIHIFISLQAFRLVTE